MICQKFKNSSYTICYRKTVIQNEKKPKSANQKKLGFSGLLRYALLRGKLEL
jgi:hypothetical protein